MYGQGLVGIGIGGYLGPPDVSKFDDIVNFERCVYAIDHSGRLDAIHYDSIWPKGRKHYQTLRVNCVVNEQICSGCDGEKREPLVVDSSGVLYLAQRTVYCGEKLHFKVYKLYKICSKWDEVIGLVTTGYCLWVLMGAFLCRLLIFQITK